MEAWQGQKLLLWPVCLSHCCCCCYCYIFLLLYRPKLCKQVSCVPTKKEPTWKNGPNKIRENILQKKTLFRRQLLDCRKLVALVARFVVNYKENKKKGANFMKSCLGMGRPLMFLGRLISRWNYCFRFFLLIWERPSAILQKICVNFEFCGGVPTFGNCGGCNRRQKRYKISYKLGLSRCLTII